MDINLSIEDYEAKYRKFRWVFEIPGVPAFVMQKLRFGIPDKLTGQIIIGTYAIYNDMDVDKCPLAPDGGFVLKLLSSGGEVLKHAEGRYNRVSFTGLSELDYSSGDACTSEFVLYGCEMDWMGGV